MKTMWLMTAAAAIALAGCSREAASPAEQVAQPAPLKSGVYLENMDTSVRPGDDFHEYVDGAWLARTEIPADKASYGVGYIVHEQNEDNVRIIIQEAAQKEAPLGSDEQKVGDMYASYLDWETRNAQGLKPLADEMAVIDAIQSASDLPTYFARAMRFGYGTPFEYFQYADLKKPSVYAMYLLQAGLGLPEREYYFKEGEKSENIRVEYVNYVTDMLALAGVPEARAAAERIMALETRLAEQHMLKEDTRDLNKLYNMYAVGDLPQLMPNFDWSAFMKAAQFDSLDQIVVGMVDYTRALDSIIGSTDIGTWKDYLRFHLLDATASELSKELDDRRFAFHGTVMRGTTEQREDWRRGVSVVNNTLGEVVGKVYVSRHFPPEAKARMQELVDNLVKAYAASIKELDWMGEETKAQALDKLSKFTPKIGYPDVWRDYSAVTIDAKDLFGNYQRVSEANYQREIARMHGPVDRTEWGMTPQTVNAYYSPALNEIVFPAGILQPPFFDMSADDAVNYGAIGAVIGHEIGHGFDDMGSTFDGDGVMRNWWTDEDKAEFKSRTDALTAQYSEFKVFDDLNVNGEFTLGENIGDLGGLSIALKAYQMSLGDKPAPVMDGFTGVQRVFIGYAQAWLSKSREEALRQQVGTDPHSPAKFRVNGVVRNVPEFYEAFDVKEDDALYLPPQERVKIW
jgi:putative endopeptidase